MPENLAFILFALLMVGLVVVRPLWGLWRDRRNHFAAEASADKAEAFFKASFPELQPLLHPQNVADYVTARVGRQFRDRDEWERPAGFATAARARFESAPKGERTLLLDAAGRRLAEFVLEPKEGALGAVRVGPGKFTVRRNPGEAPRVKYWHPDREFEWRGRGRWRFISRLSDEPIDTSDRDWSSSSSTSSWPASTAAATAAAVGLGGTFDGGGASAAWDGAAAAADTKGSADAVGAGNSADKAGAGDGDSGATDSSTSTSY